MTRPRIDQDPQYQPHNAPVNQPNPWSREAGAQGYQQPASQNVAPAYPGYPQQYQYPNPQGSPAQQPNRYTQTPLTHDVVRQHHNGFPTFLPPNFAEQQPAAIEVVPEKKRKAGPLAKLAVWGTIISAGITGGVLAAREFNVADAKEAQGNGLDIGSKPGSNNEGSDYAPLDLNTDISGESPARQLNVILPFLEQHRQESADAWPTGYPQPDPNQFSGKKQAAQRILNDIALDTRTASAQLSPTLADNLVGGPFAPGSPTYDSLVGHGGFKAQIIPGKPIEDRRLVDSVSDPFTQGILGDFSANGRRTIVINTVNLNDPANVAEEYVVSEVVSADGKHTTEQVQKVMRYGDSDFITGLDSWHPQQ